MKEMIRGFYMVEMSNGTTWILFFWLFGCTWADIKNKKISVSFIVAGFVVLVFCSLFYTQNLTIGSRFGGLMLGLCMLLLNRVTRNQIGVGDGLIISIIGIEMGFLVTAAILVYSLLITALYAIFLLVFRRVSNKATISYIPFVFISYLGVLFL